MSRKFMLIFFTLSAYFFVQNHGFPINSNPVSNPLKLRHRSLLESPDPKSSIADPPSEKQAPPSMDREDGDEREAAAEAPAEFESRKMGKHHSSEKSMADRGVIIGGLVAVAFAVVYCYIRVTRKKHTETLG